MKYIILLIVLAVVGVAGFWWFSQPRIDTTGKMHIDLYEGAIDTWDPQMEVVAFEREPSTMISLRWQPPQETYNHFVVSLSKADGTLVRKESGEHDRVTLDLDALEPETQYVFALQACLDRRCEQWLVAQQEYQGTTQAAEVTEATE